MQAVQHRAGAYDRSFDQMMPGSLAIREMRVTEVACLPPRRESAKTDHTHLFSKADVRDC